jgi:hypothetical protein
LHPLTEMKAKKVETSIYRVFQKKEEYVPRHIELTAVLSQDKTKKQSKEESEDLE